MRHRFFSRCILYSGVGYRNFTALQWPVANRQSAISNRQSAIGNRQSAIGNLGLAILFNLLTFQPSYLLLLTSYFMPPLSTLSTCLLVNSSTDQLVNWSTGQLVNLLTLQLLF